jgi:crotonobetainyl-CoA:carnitine CoA-transferase CaiB-like acyl-CoA transferase
LINADIGATPAPPDGLRVIEIANWISGPLTGRMLADLGADVIKVEQPPRVDAMRSYGRRVGGVGMLAFNVNHGKRSVLLDLTTPAGQSQFAELLATADVLIENWRIGVADRLRLDDDTIRQANPRLVRLVISGYGPVGPQATQPVYDPLIQAWSGLARVNGRGERPLCVASTVIDKETVTFAALTILAALRARDSDGFGARVDVSMLDVSAYMNLPDRLDTLLDHPPRPIAPGTAAKSEVLQTADGHLIVAPASATYETLTSEEHGGVRRVRFPMCINGRRLDSVSMSPLPGSRSMADALIGRTTRNFGG